MVASALTRTAVTALILINGIMATFTTFASVKQVLPVRTAKVIYYHVVKLDAHSQVLGSLSNDDGNGNENVTDYFNSLNFYKNGELSRN